MRWLRLHSHHLEIPCSTKRPTSGGRVLLSPVYGGTVDTQSAVDDDDSRRARCAMDTAIHARLDERGQRGAPIQRLNPRSGAEFPLRHICSDQNRTMWNLWPCACRGAVNRPSFLCRGSARASSPICRVPSLPGFCGTRLTGFPAPEPMEAPPVPPPRT